MDHCPELDRMLERMSDELSEADQLAILEHVRKCATCRAQFQRMTIAARALQQSEDNALVVAEHITDMDLAEFAARGENAERAGEVIAHLATCSRCRQELAAIRISLEQFDELIDTADESGDGGERSPGVVERLRLAFSSPRRAAYALGAACLFAAECGCFAFVLVQLLLAYVIGPLGYDAVPEVWPLTYVPAGALRLWTLVIGAGGIALGFRRPVHAMWKRAVG